MSAPHALFQLEDCQLSREKNLTFASDSGCTGDLDTQVVINGIGRDPALQTSRSNRKGHKLPLACFAPVYPLAGPVVLGHRSWRLIMTPEESAALADRRLHPRVPVALPAFLQAEGKRHPVHLMDLSAGGAKLKCAATLASGTKVILDCGTLGRAAVVRWQNEGLIGLCFESELDAREVAALMDRSRALETWMKARP